MSKNEELENVVKQIEQSMDRMTEKINRIYDLITN